MAKKRGKQHPIRVGVVGVGRGRSFMQAAAATGMELVAICDIWEERLIAEGKALNVPTFVDYDEFLGCDMDAVVLANYFHQHAPFAIKALNAGKHVMSETAACHTLGEGVALARTVEKSGKICMFAENYPYMVFNQEMKRLYQQGGVGEFKYGEGEYVHPDPPEVKLARSCGRDHWRNWIPATYYCTHSIAPVMYITDTRPVKVNGFVIPFDFADPTQTLHMNRSDTAAVIICRMDNDAVMKSLHGALRGHGNYVRIHGNKGVMENCRHGDKQRLRVWYEPWEKRQSDPVETVYSPDFPVHHGLAARAGHGGGDFFHQLPLCRGHPHRRAALSRRVPRHRHEHRRDPSVAFGTERLSTAGNPRLPPRVSAPKIRQRRLVARPRAQKEGAAAEQCFG